MLGREVEEREQLVDVLLEAVDGLVVLGSEHSLEGLDPLVGEGPVVGVHDLTKHALRLGLEPLGELVEDVAHLVAPVPLRAGL